MDGLFHGKSQSKMDANWGYPRILGNPQFFCCDLPELVILIIVVMVPNGFDTLGH